jgi:hypothetical protein
MLGLYQGARGSLWTLPYLLIASRIILRRKEKMKNMKNMKKKKKMKNAIQERGGNFLLSQATAEITQ